jgi:hypothetical protein
MMTLAAILVFYFLSLGSGSDPALQGQAAPQAQSTSAPNPGTAQPSSAQQQNATQPSTKPHTTPRRKVKKLDCIPSSADAKPVDGKPASTSANSASAQANPCPPQKKIVKNGGTDEPTVQLKSDAKSAPDQVATTEQLRAATEDNLKKITGRQLSTSQQQMLDQIKLFMNQSKAAVAEGDAERGHNLAVKARLLSDELVNP